MIGCPLVRWLLYLIRLCAYLGHGFTEVLESATSVVIFLGSVSYSSCVACFFTYIYLLLDSVMVNHCQSGGAVPSFASIECIIAIALLQLLQEMYGKGISEDNIIALVT